MANILFLTQVLPFPLDAGPKVRAYHMLRRLAQQHNVTLVSFVRPDDPPEALTHLRALCAAVHPVPMRRSAARNIRAGLEGLISGLPMVIARDKMAEMDAVVRGLAAGGAFDVVHADQLSMAWWGQRAVQSARAAGHSLHALLDQHNAIYLLIERMAANESQPWRRVLMAREARAFRRYEAAMCRAFDAVLTVTSEDRERLLALSAPAARAAANDSLFPSALLPAKFTVVPICVDPTQVAAVPRQPGSPPAILHLGTMFWPPNVTGVLWFAQEIWPRVRVDVPNARFVIVGKNPPAEVQALAADPSIIVTGYVSDPTPYLAAADAFIVPLHAGGGMRVKILDAWLWGLPIVSTPIGAEGIELRAGENILIADDAPAFVAAVVRCLTDPALNAHLRAAGRAWVEDRYAWQRVYHKVDEVYARLTP